MQKTDIDWADMSWNPVTGCLHGCEYCYARGIARRFAGYWSEEHQRNLGADGGMHVVDKPMYRHTTGKNRTKPVHSVQASYPYGFCPTFHRYRLDEPASKKEPQNVFVGSMCDLFGNWVPDEWIEEVFAACADAPQHRYLFLTKNPLRYNALSERGLLPDGGNYWLGTTVTKNIEGNRVGNLIADRKAFVSVEPIHGKIILAAECVDWAIIGAENSQRKDKVVPEREWIDNIVQNCREAGTAVFMKESLRVLMGDDFVQEYPWEVKKQDGNTQPTP